MMESTDGLHELARRLLAQETGDVEDLQLLIEGAERACQKLRSQIAIILGSAGFQATLVQAARRTQPAVPFLSIDPILQDAECLRGIRQSLQGREADEVREALTILWGNFLTLMTGLVGRDLTVSFLRAAWPDAEIE